MYAHTHTHRRGNPGCLGTYSGHTTQTRSLRELRRCQLFAYLGNVGLERGRMERKESQDCLVHRIKVTFKIKVTFLQPVENL